MKHVSALSLNIPLMIPPPRLERCPLLTLCTRNTFFPALQATQVWQIKAVESLDWDKNFIFFSETDFYLLYFFSPISFIPSL